MQSYAQVAELWIVDEQDNRFALQMRRELLTKWCATDFVLKGRILCTGILLT